MQRKQRQETATTPTTTTYCKPLRDVVSATEHNSELGSRQVLGVQTLLLGVVGRGVTFVFGVDQVQRRHGLDLELFEVGVGNVLGIIGAVVERFVQTGTNRSSNLCDLVSIW
jgi:hypothetical protein